MMRAFKFTALLVLALVYFTEAYLFPTFHLPEKFEEINEDPSTAQPIVNERPVVTIKSVVVSSVRRKL